MSSQCSTSPPQSPKQFLPASTYIIQKALRRGIKACNELKYGFRSPDVGNQLITTGEYVPGVRQDFVLHGTKPVNYF
jgi:hypothetical protein